jgi:hypothetical protein
MFVCGWCRSKTSSVPPRCRIEKPPRNNYLCILILSSHRASEAHTRYTRFAGSPDVSLLCHTTLSSDLNTYMDDSIQLYSLGTTSRNCQQARKSAPLRGASTAFLETLQRHGDELRSVDPGYEMERHDRLCVQLHVRTFSNKHI